MEKRHDRFSPYGVAASRLPEWPDSHTTDSRFPYTHLDLKSKGRVREMSKAGPERHGETGATLKSVIQHGIRGGVRNKEKRYETQQLL